MKSILILGSLLLSSMAFAETATYEVHGMHCGGCKSAIEGSVCKMEGVKSCKVEMTNAKKQIGKLTLTTEDGKTIDTAKAQELVSAAGDYKLVAPKK